MKRRLVIIGLAVLMALGGVIAVSSAANAAPSCYGDYCSAQYPDQVGCSQDAITVQEVTLTKNVYDVGVSTSDGWSAAPRQVPVGKLQLRHSPSCGTVWGRVDITVPTVITSVRVKQEATGYEQEHILWPNPFNRAPVSGTFFSRQIYTQGYRSQAYVNGADLNEESKYTPWW